MVPDYNFVPTNILLDLICSTPKITMNCIGGRVNGSRPHCYSKLPIHKRTFFDSQLVCQVLQGTDLLHELRMGEAGKL